MFDQQGMILGERYEMLSFIGKGGMSQVWKARHIHLDKFMAIKLLSKNLLDKEQFVARFKQEAQIASRLSHENICGVSDFGFTEDNVPYIVMEYLEGESLADVFRRIQRLPVGASLSIIRQALIGLIAAHKIGVVHRDVKPGNIFIVEEKSGKRIIKILDFGISKMVASKDKKDLGLTSTGTMLGTPFYLSPEQIMESKAVDHKTDIYATGAVLFKLLTGRVPYIGENYAEIAVKVVNEPLPDPRRFVKGLDRAVAKITKRAMAKDCMSRYQSADTMLSDVERVIESYKGDTISALYRPGLESLILKPVEQEPARFGKRTRIAAVALSLAIIVGVAAVILSITLDPFGFLSESAGTSSSVREEPVAGNEGGEEAGEEAAAGEEDQRVTITIGSAPPGLRIIAGDEEFSGSVIALDKSSEPMKIRFVAEGYIEREVTLVPVADLEIDASMEQVPETPAKEKATGKPKGMKKKNGVTKKAGDTKKPKEKEKKKGGGMDFIRDFPKKK